MIACYTFTHFSTISSYHQKKGIRTRATHLWVCRLWMNPFEAQRWWELRWVQFPQCNSSSPSSSCMSGHFTGAFTTSGVFQRRNGGVMPGTGIVVCCLLYTGLFISEMSYRFNSQWDTFLVSLTNVSTLSHNGGEWRDERIEFFLANLAKERCAAKQHSLLLRCLHYCL